MEEFKFVEIAEKRYPMRFGMNALRKYGKRTNTSLSDLEKMGEDMDLDNALQLILCGIEDGYRKAKQQCKLNIESLADLIDEDYEAIARCMDILSKQMGGKTKKKQNPKSAKK